MFDTENLRTASLYLNNQLLSRGLLRDGQTIDFSGSEQQGSETMMTMGRIMSVVNDLILRGDRDAEHRESLSMTLRALKTENIKFTNDLTKLSEKNDEATRKLHLAESMEASLKAQLKSAESAARGLKEEIARTKALISQTRSACATDVRRRDRQIDTMKKQLSDYGRARGTRGSPGITAITITPTARRDQTTTESVTNAANEDYSLRNETNAFLASLAQNLSEENESLIKLLRQTLSRLKDMSGLADTQEQELAVIRQPGLEDLPVDLESVLEHMMVILTNPSFVPIEEVTVREEEIARLKDGWFKMETRWKEAMHLIDRWRKQMAANGKPIAEGELRFGLSLSPVKMNGAEAVKNGIVGVSLAAIAEEGLSEELAQAYPEDQESEDVDMIPTKDQTEYQDELGSQDSKMLDDQDDRQATSERTHDSQGCVSKLEADRSSSPPLPEPPRLSPLKPSSTAANRGQAPMQRPLARLVEDPSTTEKKAPIAFAAEAVSKRKSTQTKLPAQRAPPRTRLNKGIKRPLTVTKAATSTQIEFGEESAQTTETDMPEAMPIEGDIEETHFTENTHQEPASGSSESSSPSGLEPRTQQSPLTMSSIAAKLAASERQADAARVRAKLRAARDARGVQKPDLGNSRPSQARKDSGARPLMRKQYEDDNNENADPVKCDPVPIDESQAQPVKRQRVNKAASRRRSTLSPWELETLISGAAKSS